MDLRIRGALLTGLLLACGAAVTASADPALVSVSGEVEIGRGTPPAWRTARGGDRVAFGDAVRTGDGGRAELALGDGRVVRVYERSLLRIGSEVTPTGGARSVELGEGKSLFDVMRKAVGDEFEVHTPEIIVSVKGTRFLVAAVPGPDFTSVFRGAVGLAGPGFDEVAVRAGFTGAEGEVLVHSFDDPWSGWGAGAPAPELAVGQRREAEVRGAIETARVGRLGRREAGPPAQAEEGKDRLLGGAKDDVPNAVREGAPLDPVVDVARGNRGPGGGSLLDEVLDSDDGGPPDDGGSGGNGTPFPFTFDVVTSGGPNTVTVGFGGQSVTLDQNDVDTLLQGNQNPLGGFNGVVNSLGVDQDELAEYLDDLI